MGQYINQLRKQLETAKEMLQFSEQEYNANKDDFSLKLTVATYSKLVDKLSSQLINQEVFEKGFFLLINNNDLIEAKNCLLQAINSAPAYLGVLNNCLIQKYQQDNNHIDAIRAFQFFLDIKPDYELARNNLAMLFISYGLDLCKQAFSLKLSNTSKETTFIAPSSDSTAYTAYMEAINYFNKSLSVATSDKIVTVRKTISKLYADLATTLLEKKLYIMSAEYFQIAENSGFISPEVYNDHAVALALAGHYKEAQFKLHQALELDPNNPKTKANYQKLSKNCSTNLKKILKPSSSFELEQLLLKDFSLADAA